MNPITSRRPAAFLIAGGLTVALLSACGGGSGSSSDTGQASFSVTDAPVDNVETVKITFNRIDLKHSGGNVESFDFSDNPVVIDNLLALTGNAAEAIVSDVEVQAGNYEWLRIYVVGGNPDSLVTPNDGGNPLPLFIPGQQNGNSNGNPRFLQLNTGFTVAAGGQSDFTIDFVLRKGLTKPANSDHYLLRPAMRLVNNVEVGTIVGTVDPAVVDSPTCVDENNEPTGRTVYLYEGDLTTEGLTPDDVYDPGIATNSDTVEEAEGVRPITTAEVNLNENNELAFAIGFVRVIPEGYSLAFSCQSANDDPATDDDIAFTEVVTTQVEAGQTSEVEFTVVPVVDTQASAETTTATET